MAAITVRNIAESTKRKLRVRAASHGRSMEEEMRQILLDAVERKVRVPSNLAEAIASIVDPLGGIELDLPPRQRLRQPPKFAR